jgi:Fur family zinc uptake transcriptional regulator
MIYYNMTSPKPIKTPPKSQPLGFVSHDHGACVSQALAAVEKACADRELRLTPPRRKVLELLLREHRALGAYAILDLLRDAGFKSQPPVAYRALDFLVEHGFAHKIERLNAFVACAHPDIHHSPGFLICRLCDAVGETQSGSADAGLGATAAASGFEIERTTIEVEGICPACQAKAIK